jgi:hypothetical protein
MIELPHELRQAVTEQAGKPVALVDPATREIFILVRSELYERLARLVYDDGDQSVAEAYPLLDEMAAKPGGTIQPWTFTTTWPPRSRHERPARGSRHRRLASVPGGPLESEAAPGRGGAER